jgi:hypothetical protein
MKKTPLAIALILAISFSVVDGIKMINLAEANPI